MRVLEQLRVTNVMRSNHSDRLEKYVRTYAPGLADEPELQLERYMRYADLGHHVPPQMWEFAPGWLLAHGDEGGLSQEAGKTALGLARRAGRSVVCGHTHRAGIVPLTEAFGGKHVRTIYGMEVGCLMELAQASYLRSGGANWQLAFGLFHIDGKHVSPHVIFMRPDGSFAWDKRIWTP
jgi:hypothetical protein